MSYILLATLRRDLFVGGASLLEMGSIVIGRESWVAMMLLLSCCLMLLCRVVWDCLLVMKWLLLENYVGSVKREALF